MIKNIRFAIVMILVVGCIEPYQFRIPDADPGIVIEATLSDKSFNDTKNYPSNGRYFTVKVSKTSDVTNVRSQMVSYATVVLSNDQGEAWEYLEVDPIGAPGVYKLLDDDFKALSGVRYKLSVTTPDNAHIESDWQDMPSNAPAIGPVSFQETNTQRVVLDKVRDVRGVKPQMTLPANETGSTIYYRWKFLPTWLFDAPLASSTASAVKYCWATTTLYIRDYTVQADDEGGYNKDLFFMDIADNERVLHEFSVLIEQQAMTEEYYYFWKEMQDLSQTAGVFATPPFNIKSNFTTSQGKVFGYFGVVREQGLRWYFNRTDLSYEVPNWLPEQCATPCGPGCPPPACLNCLRYEGGDVTNVRPTWWGR
ncbi:MAG TPA: DUF4249 domain-containing protein [Chryseolinea sp.]|nr:DUF4249 domain-containing protein [Chryseolinea sp.]